MRPEGILDGAVLDWLPPEAVEEEDDGHDEGGHNAPGNRPVFIRSGGGSASWASLATLHCVLQYY